MDRAICGRLTELYVGWCPLIYFCVGCGQSYKWADDRAICSLLVVGYNYMFAVSGWQSYELVVDRAICWLLTTLYIGCFLLTTMRWLLTEVYVGSYPLTHLYTGCCQRYMLVVFELIVKSLLKFCKKWNNEYFFESKVLLVKIILYLKW